MKVEKGTVEKGTYSDAMKELLGWRRRLSELDFLLCRKGGHPDLARQVTDRQLHNALIRIYDAIAATLEVILLREEEE